MGTVPAGGRKDLTDAQWRLLAPLLPASSARGRPPILTRRQLIDGIGWRIRTGAPWRDVPERYGSWQSVYGLFRRWQRDGTWARVWRALQQRADALGLITWDVSVDSTITRAHQHAAGARRDPELQREPPGETSADEPADHGLGRSRGGLSTKIHLACDQGRKPLSFVLTAGQAGDSPQFTTVLDRVRVARRGPGRPRVRPDRVLADKTSHAPWLSSGGLGRGVAGGGEGGVFVVALSGAQAVVQDADEPVEQVALGGDVPVSGVLAAVVVGSGAG